MAEQYLTFTEETWPRFSDGISKLNKKANSAIKGVKQDGTELTPDENGVVNIESSNVDVTTVVTSASQPTGLKDGDIWEEVINGETISENESASSDNVNIGVLGNYIGTIDTFPTPGTVGVTYIDTDSDLMYLWDEETSSYTIPDKPISKTNFVIPAEDWTLETDIYTYSVEANVSPDDSYTWYMQPLNGIYITDEDVDIDFALKGMKCLDGQIKFFASTNIATEITITVEGVE